MKKLLICLSLLIPGLWACEPDTLRKDGTDPRPLLVGQYEGIGNMYEIKGISGNSTDTTNETVAVIIQLFNAKEGYLPLAILVSKDSVGQTVMNAEVDYDEKNKKYQRTVPPQTVSHIYSYSSTDMTFGKGDSVFVFYTAYSKVIASQAESTKTYYFRGRKKK